MRVRELILALQELPEEVQDSYVSAEYREFGGPLDIDGDPVDVEFDSLRVDTIGKRKRKRYNVVLY